MTLIGPYGNLNLVLGWISFAAICMRSCERKSCFPLRVILSAAICIALQLHIDYVGRSIPLYYAQLGIFFLCLHLCFRNTIWQTLFVFGIAYAMQYLMYSLWDISSTLLIPNYVFLMDNAGVRAIYFISWAAMVAIAWNITKGFKHFAELESFYPPVVVIFLVLVLVAGFLCDQINQFEDGRAAIVARLLSSLVCALGIWISIDVLVRRKIKMDNAMQQYIIERQKSEFELRKETINDLNIKCHDLKYQIRAIYDRASRNDTSELREIEDCITAFQSSYQTGSEALDIVLSEKARTCAEKGISFTFMGNGELISFMSDTDIYRLFNNAIDNSIEALEKVDEDKRSMSVIIDLAGPFISVLVENYYNGQLEFSNDMPLTSKENKRNHGFGVKSIKAIADSYSAQFSFEYDEDVFTLNLLFPAPQN